MKKCLLIAVFLTLIDISLFPVDLRYINLGKIENIDNYRQDIGFIIENQDYMRDFVPDDLWKSRYSRSELALVTEAAYQKVCSYPENDNQEYLLLKAAISEYLYNLDELRYYQNTVDSYNAVEKIPACDYRYRWFLGLFYAKSCHPYESIREFQFVTGQFPRETLPSAFFADYAYAQVLALMPLHAIENFDYVFSTTDKRANNELYNALVKRFVTYDGKEEIGFNDLFFPQERENNSSGIFSRLLGVWIKLNPDWRVGYSGLKDNIFGFRIGSQKIRHKSGKDITYSILIFSVLDSDGSIENDYQKTLPNLVPVEFFGDDKFSVYEYGSPNIYRDIGGSHGYFVKITCDYSVDAELEIEKPSMVKMKNSKGVTYLHFEKEYRRYKGTITHYILLDSCNFIFDESKREFIDFLNSSDFQ